MQVEHRLSIICGLIGLVALAGCGTDGGAELSARHVAGAVTQLGNGDVESYAEVDANGVPTALGVSFAEAAFDGLPRESTDGHRCFDGNRDGQIEPDAECSSWHERVIPLPTELTRREDIPFKWVLLNWNNHGHIPPGVWDQPHFDIHFYIEPIEDVFALQRGPCGPEFLRCDQFELATKAVPSGYISSRLCGRRRSRPSYGEPSNRYYGCRIPWRSVHTLLDLRSL